MLRLATLSLLGLTLPTLFAAAAPTTETAAPPAWRMNYPDLYPAPLWQEDDIIRFASFGYLPASTQEATVTLIENAENGTDGFTVVADDGDFPVVQDKIVIEGSLSFHLFHVQPATNTAPADCSLTLTTPVTITPGLHLYFESWLRRSGTGEHARVQLSTDGGSTWPVTVFSQTGPGGEADSTYTLHEVDLSAYAGQTVRLRFFYEFTTGSYYKLNQAEHETTTGWFFDNIQLGTAFTKRLYSIGDPTGDEQYYLEMINRARADANAEAQRLANTTDPDVLAAVNYFGVDLTRMLAEFAGLEQTVQPLSFNEKLLASARLHSQDMYANTYQGHMSSPTPPAPNQSGDIPGDRATRQGYDFSYIGENVYANAESVFQAHAAFEIDWGDDTNDNPAAAAEYIAGVDDQDGMQDPAGHRENIHGPGFKEVGIGVINGSNSGPDWTQGDQLRDVGPQVVTQDFAIPQADSAFITGVVFDDDDGNKRYDPGEGAGGVRIDVDGSVYYAVSAASGGYSVPVYADGTYTLTFDAPGYPNVTRTVTVTGMQNVKADWRRLRLTVSSVTNSPSNLTSIVFHADSESPTAVFSLLKSDAPGGPYSEVSGASPTGPLGDNEAYTYTYQRSPGEEVFFRVRIED
jgi:uncharacterized protein YkwD